MFSRGAQCLHAGFEQRGAKGVFTGGQRGVRAGAFRGDGPVARGGVVHRVVETRRRELRRRRRQGGAHVIGDGEIAVRRAEDAGQRRRRRDPRSGRPRAPLPAPPQRCPAHGGVRWGAAARARVARAARRARLRAPPGFRARASSPAGAAPTAPRHSRTAARAGEQSFIEPRRAEQQHAIAATESE